MGHNCPPVNKGDKKIECSIKSSRSKLQEITDQPVFHLKIVPVVTDMKAPYNCFQAEEGAVEENASWDRS